MPPYLALAGWVAESCLVWLWSVFWVTLTSSFITDKHSYMVIVLYMLGLPFLFCVARAKSILMLQYFCRTFVRCVFSKVTETYVRSTGFLNKKIFCSIPNKGHCLHQFICVKCNWSAFTKCNIDDTNQQCNWRQLRRQLLFSCVAVDLFNALARCVCFIVELATGQAI